MDQVDKKKIVVYLLPMIAYLLKTVFGIEIESEALEATLDVAVTLYGSVLLFINSKKVL